jgi:hypothetical protein
LIVGSAPSAPPNSSNEYCFQKSVVEAMTTGFRGPHQATLAGPDWDDEMDERPWIWATLCGTIMPAGVNVSGDRDCPR